jgi:hypothetical protein
MFRSRLVFVSAVVAAACTLSSPVWAQSARKGEYLKEAPPSGALPRGKVVYVDDGACPKGEVKEITGGSESKSIPRAVRCVKRTD